jgi:hypothetical protein
MNRSLIISLVLTVIAGGGCARWGAANDGMAAPGPASSSSAPAKATPSNDFGSAVPDDALHYEGEAP